MISINDNFNIDAPKVIDSRYGIYPDTATAISSVPIYKRALGLTVGIGTPVNEYWWAGGLTDSDLVLKTADTSIEWGEIGGTLSNQTDLINALNGKQNSLGFTPVSDTRTLTINGVGYDLTKNRSWNVTASAPSLDEVLTVGNTSNRDITIKQIFAVPTINAQFKVTSGYAQGTPLMGLSYFKFSGFLSGTVGTQMFFDQSGFFTITGYPRSDWDNNTLGAGAGNVVVSFDIPTNLTTFIQPVQMNETLVVNKDFTNYGNVYTGKDLLANTDLKNTLDCNAPSSNTFGSFFEIVKSKNGGAITNDLIGGIRWKGTIDVDYNTVDAADIRVFGLSATWGTAANRSSYMIFRTRNADSYGERMRITNDGNVLIGTTTNGTFRLDVNGRVRIQNMLTLGNITSNPTGANGMIFYNTTTNTLNAFINGAWRIITAI